MQDRSTPLHWAALRGSDEVAEMLLAHASIDVNAKDARHLTPLQWTKISNKPSMEDTSGKARVERLLLSDHRVVLQ
jgi:ankyrin repeat protein